jgi:hypothetical protein
MQMKTWAVGAYLCLMVGQLRLSYPYIVFVEVLNGFQIGQVDGLAGQAP